MTSVNRETLAKAAETFLKDVIESTAYRIKSNLLMDETRQWMVKTGPTSHQSQQFMRKVVNRDAIHLAYQRGPMRQPIESQTQLKELLAEAGIPQDRMDFGYLVPLINRWLSTPSPLEFQPQDMAAVVQEFVTVVIDGRLRLKSRDMFRDIELSAQCLDLDDEVQLRPITSDELWEFSDPKSWMLGISALDMPYEGNTVLEIGVTAPKDEPRESAARIGYLRAAALAALRLAAPGIFQLEQTFGVTNYAFAGIGSNRFRGFHNGVGGPSPYQATGSTAEWMLKVWPDLRKIFESGDHYLRLPAQRLVDAGMRGRNDDAVIDYTIGLEALLLGGEREELRYRFALRGATVLTWAGGSKRDDFKRLQDLYDVRSRIVHGGLVTAPQLAEARRTGEQGLRSVWRWFFETGDDKKDQAVAKIDERLLG